MISKKKTLDIVNTLWTVVGKKEDIIFIIKNAIDLYAFHKEFKHAYGFRIWLIY